MKSWGNAINGSLPKWNAAGYSDSWRHRPRNPHVRLCEPLCGLLRGGAVSLPGEGFQAVFEQIFGGSSDSAEDKNRGPAEAQRSGFGGKRRRSGMSECSPLSAETRDMELAPTRSRIKISKPGRELRFFLRDRLSGTVQIRTVGGSVPPLQYPSPHSILQSRLKCGIIAHGKDVRIMLLKKIYCRMFQACFGLGARVLPWRRPECITGAGSLQASGGAGGCAGSVPHREPEGEGPGIY